MKFAIQINSSPHHNQAGLTAYRFIEAALAQGHSVPRVFFYHEGIYHACRHSTPPADETDLGRLWAQLAAGHGVDLLVCVSAAQRRGLLHGEEARRRGKQDDDLAPGFRIGGLGQWLEAVLAADRVLVFG